MGINRKIPLFAVLFVSALIILPGIAGAASANRDLPSSVEEGEVFTVAMTVSGYGTIGNVVEILPPGFTFVDSTLDAAQVVPDPANNSVQFLLLNDVSFDYTVTASGTEGTYGFSGIILDVNQNEFQVEGDSTLNVVAAPSNGDSGGSSSIAVEDTTTVEPIMEETAEENVTEENETEMMESEETAEEETAEEETAEEETEDEEAADTPISPFVTAVALMIAFFVFRKQK